MLDNSTCSNADSELKGTSQTEETYTLEVVVPPEATNSDARSFIRSLKVKFYVGDKNGEKEDDGEPVEFDYLLKFLVIWFHSKTGKGVMFCSDAVWERHISAKKDYAKVMALNSNERKIPVAVRLFSDRAKKQEPSEYFNRIVCAVLFGRLRWSKDDKNIIDKVFIQGLPWYVPGSNDKISYSTRRLDLQLIIPDSFFDGLLKYKNDIAELKSLPTTFLHELKSALVPSSK